MERMTSQEYIQQEIEYKENHPDSLLNYVHLLVDDAVYHRDSWESVIVESLGFKPTADTMGLLIDRLVDLEGGEIVAGNIYDDNERTLASFAIQEHEIVPYEWGPTEEERREDGWTYSSGCNGGWITYVTTDATVEYRLLHDDLLGMFRDIVGNLKEEAAYCRLL